MARLPTPNIKGNLPHHRSEEWDESEGRELPARPIEWYERASPRNAGHGTFTSDPDHDQLPEILDRWNKGGGKIRGYVYGKGGKVIKSEEY